MRLKTFIQINILLIILGVTLGALGAHALEGVLDIGPDQIESWKTAVFYQLFQSLGVVVIILLHRHFSIKRLHFIAWILTIGTILFSFSIYLLVLNYIWDLQFLKMIMIPLTPIGGILMITGWIALFWSFMRMDMR